MEVISIEEIQSFKNEYVYDLETEVGTFVAGGIKNGILVKNTDSCYVKFPIELSDFPSRDEFMVKNFELAKECAKYCTSHFKFPMNLDFEKYMYPAGFFKKKRYMYIEWTNPLCPDELPHAKGLQNIRRDTCRYVRDELNEIFNIILTQKTKQQAYEVTVKYVKKSIKNLLDGNVNVNKLVLTKQLKSRYAVRKNNQTKEYHWKNEEIQHPHVRLAQQLAKINPADHPKPPDRVPFLFIEKKGVTLQCDKVIHPQQYNPTKYKLDTLYYFEHQYKKPLDAIFYLVLGLDPELKKSEKIVEKIYKDMVVTKINQINGQQEPMLFFLSNESKETKEFYYNPELFEELEIDDVNGSSDREELE